MGTTIFPRALLYRASVAVLVLGSISCTGNSAIVTFSANAQKVGDVLPRVAEIPFHSCVQREINRQLSNASELPDRHAAEAACATQAAARDGLFQTYRVLTLYMSLLGKVATGSTLPAELSVKSISTTAAGLSGTSAAQKASVAGLANALAHLYLHARTEAALRRALSEADPHVQALCLAFHAQIEPELNVILDSGEGQLRALYREKTPADGSRLLYLRQFANELDGIDQDRQIAAQFGSALNDLAQAHAKLVQHRDHLHDRATAADLLALSGSLEAHLQQINASGK